MEGRQKERYLQAFLIAFAGCMLCLIPIMIINGGRFFYYGDYNKQQVMFYTHLVEQVRSGTLSSWDVFADLGSDTAASYSFYLLGSPFFWLMCLFPARLAVTLLPIFIALKTGIAALGAYIYARLFVKNRNAALIAAVLFGLSSYNSANLLFNHFHDAVLMIPFMLWAMERLFREGRHGFFALTVALAAFINYYFFFGQALFLIVYFVIALITGHFRFTARRFGLLAFEAVLGVLLSAVLLLPSAMAVASNPRVTDFISGSGLFVYGHKSIYLYILKNMLMLPDITLIKNYGVERANELQNNYHSSYIHFFSLCGVITYYRCFKGKRFFKVLLAVCGVFMMIPVFNQAFSFFNGKFYGRWFFMPLLIACVMTALAAEGHCEGTASLKKGFVPTLVLTVMTVGASAAVILLSKAEVISVGFEDRGYAYTQILFTLTALAFLWLTLYRPSVTEAAAVIRQLTVRAAVFCTAGLAVVVVYSYLDRGTSEDYIMNDVFDYYGSGEDFSKPDDPFFRVSCEANLMNMPVIWGYPCVRYFNSTVEPSIMSFYTALDMERSVKSDYEPDEYPLMELLSVKYYADQAYFDEDGNAKPPAELLPSAKSYRIVSQQNNINFYENTEFIPMGLAFDKYTTMEALAGQPGLLKEFAYLEAIVLDSEQAERFSDILEPYDIADITSAAERYHEICEKRRALSCSRFEMQGSSFEAEITLEKPALVFFSVPYSEGWSAEVNGEHADTEMVYNGLMAVRCEAGANSISFAYSNKYLTAGLIITAAAAAVMAVYIILCCAVKHRADKQTSKEK